MGILASIRKYRGRLREYVTGICRALRGSSGEAGDAEKPNMGTIGEQLAERYLRKLGYQIVERSNQSRAGEIDLIAIDRRTVVFVEVKTRRSHERGHPADAVDRDKQRRLVRLALAWLKRQRLLDARVRFDVIAITMADAASSADVRHYQSAFESDLRWQFFA